MFKKITFISTAVLLTACGNLSNSISYKISDEDTQKWILEGNKAEQCLFPKEWKNRSFSSLSDAERMLHQRYVYDLPLIQTITLENAQKLMNDNFSVNYLNQQYHKFNHSNKIDFDQNWCNAIKNQYKQELIQAKEYVKQQKAKVIAQQKELEKQRIQAEKERKAEAAFYASKEGQAYLAQQRLMAQQQAAQHQMELQQQAYQQQLAAQRREYENRLAIQNATHTLSQVATNLTNQMNNISQQMNYSTQQIQATGQRNSNWGNYGPASGSVKCYNINNITRCNY